jgi:hypothetical protein
MNLLRSIKVIGMVVSIACASLSVQNNANAGTVGGALEVLASEGYSSRDIDENARTVSWRNGGQLVRALVTERSIGGSDSRNPASGSTRLAISFVIQGADEMVTPRMINAINAEAIWIKFYIDGDGDGIIERYETFRESDISDELLALKIAAYLSEIEDTWTQVTTDGTA